jgi:hypothetical integral membrane protein (TIGR02206 family)
MPGRPQGAFVLFGTQHWWALIFTAVVASLAVGVSRRRPALAETVGRAAAILLVTSGAGYIVVDALSGTSWRHWAPLHLCDVSVYVGAAALWTRRPLLAELTYFWGLAGALPAMLTPDLPVGFPDFHFVFYFLQHGFIVVAAALLAAADDVHPRRLAPLRAWLWLNALAGVVGIFDHLTGSNFMYLRAKPPSPTPLDLFGDWPWYILGGELVALAVFGLLYLPFVVWVRRERAQTKGTLPGMRL